MTKTKNYRVTPANNKWIIQSIEDRKTIKVDGSPFKLKSAAEQAMFTLEISGSTTPVIKDPGGLTFNEVFKKFAQKKLDLKNDRNRVNQTSLNRYMREYDLRISKYISPNLLLSEFKLQEMENYLKAAYDDGVPFKTLKNSVKDIKHFIRKANMYGWGVCRDMETFSIFDYHYVVPNDDALLFRKETAILDDETCMKMINTNYQEMWNDLDAANRFAILCLLFILGLRASEMIGLKRSNVDLANKIIKIKGVFIQAEGGYLNRTKNRGSNRDMPLDESAVKFFTMWFEYLDKNHKYNDWVLPGMRGDGPLSYKYVNAQIWKNYAAHGLAEIVCRRDGHVKIISSSLKGAPTKTFRHKLGSKLISSMNSVSELGRNEVKAAMGHTKFETSAEIYGDKLLTISKLDQEKLASARGKATNTNLISQIISKK